MSRKPDEERREQERHAEHEHVELQQERQDQQPVGLWGDLLPGDEPPTTGDVDQQT